MSDDTGPTLPAQRTRGHLIDRVVIGVFGNAQHGKDTAAKLIEQSLKDKGKRAKRLALADPLKEVAQSLLGMPAGIAWGADDGDISLREQQRLSWTKYGKNAREWLQWIGTELGREQIDDCLWVDRAVDRVVGDEEGTEFFIITDCRFNNERITLPLRFRERFIRFVPLRIYRPCVPVNMMHVSEAEVAAMTADMFASVIDNDSDMDGLRSRVDEFVSNHLFI